MVISQSPKILESVRKISVHANFFPDMNRQFLPMFRYHNPKLDVEANNKDGAVALELTFVDDSRKSVAEIRSFHDAAQIIIDSDREKTLELVSSR